MSAAPRNPFGLRVLRVFAVLEPKRTRVSTGRQVDANKPTRTRADSKQAQLIAILQSHTVPGAIAGALKKKRGLDVTFEKVEGRDRVYSIRGVSRDTSGLRVRPERLLLTVAACGQGDRCSGDGDVGDEDEHPCRC